MRKYLERLIKKNSLFNNISEFDYVNIDDHKRELVDVESEIVEVENTIRYYINRKKILEDWKRELEISILKWDDEDICRNCRYYNHLYCSKFQSTVNEDATCSSFEWSLEDLDFVE